MNIHSPQAASVAAIVRYHEAIAEAHLALAELAKAQAAESDAALPSPLAARQAPETVSTGEGREERAVTTVPPSLDASPLEPAPVETGPDDHGDEGDARPPRLVVEAVREMPPSPPPMPARVPPEFKTKRAHLENLWRNTKLTEAEILAATGFTEAGMRGVISALKLKQTDRPLGTPSRKAQRQRAVDLALQERRPSPVAAPAPAAPPPAAPLPRPAPPPALVPAAAPPAPPARPVDFPPSLTAIVNVKRREIIGPAGVLEHVAAGTCRMIERLALGKDDAVFDEGTLAGIGDFGRVEEIRAHLSRMVPSLARIGVDLQSPMKGFWRVARLDGEARS